MSIALRHIYQPTSIDSRYEYLYLLLKKMSENGLDSLLVQIGGFGKFQITIVAYISVISVLSGFCDFGYIFTAGKLKHRYFFIELPNCTSSQPLWFGW